MKTKTIQRDKDTVKVEFSIDAKEVDARFVEAEVSLRASARMLESQFEGAQGSLERKKISEDALAQESARIIAQVACERYVREGGLRLFAAPQVEIAQLPKRHAAFTFSATMQVVPEFTLSSTEDLLITVPEISEITDAMVMDEIEDMLREQSELVEVERAVEPGDVVNVTFDNKIDGKGYQGDHIEDYDYHMGSLILPARFEEELCGLKAGEHVFIEFRVEDDFENEEIAGKVTSFDLTVNTVKTQRIPYIDNDLAKRMGHTDLAAWKESVRSMLAQLAKRDDETRVEHAARQALVARLQGEIPEVLVEEQVEKYFTAFATDLKRQNITVEDYCDYLQLDIDDIRADMREQVAASVSENLALEALFRALGMELDEAEVEETARLVSIENGVGTEEFLGGGLTAEQQSAMREMTVHRLATEWLLEHTQVERQTL